MKSWKFKAAFRVESAGLRRVQVLGPENESLRKITRLEERKGQGQANASFKEYQAKVDKCIANVERLVDCKRRAGTMSCLIKRVMVELTGWSGTS